MNAASVIMPASMNNHDIPDETDILDPVPARKPETPIQAMTHVIAIKQIGALVHRMQLFFYQYQASDGGLARTAQSSEPEQACPVTIEALTV